MAIFIGAIAVVWSVALTDRWDGRTEEPVESEATGPEAPAGTEATGTAGNDRDEAAPSVADALPLPEALASEIETYREPPDRFAAWLKTFAEARDPQRETVTVAREDFDGDGAANEWAAVLFEDVRVPASEEALRRAAYGVVVAYADGGYALRSFEFPEEAYGRAKLETIAELTGDGRPDLVWASFQVGAHTSHASFTVSSWSDGELRAVEGAAAIPNVSGVAADDGKLTLTGGLIASAGAGTWQREYTDTYAVREGALVLVDRTFAESPTPYHRVVDGLWAEALGHPERAKAMFAEAIALEGASYEAYAFEAEDGAIVEGGALPDREAAFEAATKAFARLRQELLARVEAGESRIDACAAAQEAAGFDAALLPLLNSPFGYANPRWSADTLCERIDELES